MTDLVDQMFPPINRRAAPEYTDFNYWRAPMPQVQLPDLTPPSPTLSARSDTSRFSVRRLSSLTGMSRRTSKPDLQSTAAKRASSPNPTSPLSQASVLSEEPDDLELGSRRSDTSMPGSLEEESSFAAYRGSIAAGAGPDSSRRRRGRPSDINEEELMLEHDGVSAEVDDEEEDADEDEFPIGEMDFSSVPVSRFNSVAVID